MWKEGWAVEEGKVKGPWFGGRMDKGSGLDGRKGDRPEVWWKGI